MGEAEGDMAALVAAWDGRFGDPYTFAAFTWEGGDGKRESISAKFIAKRRPVSRAGSIDTAERVEVLLPRDAPDVLSDPGFIVDHFEKNVPIGQRLAFVQITIRFEGALNLHGPYEAARSWFRAQFVDARSLPVVIVLHAPFRNGSANPPHIHGMILPKRLSRHGWGRLDTGIRTKKFKTACREFWEKRLSTLILETPD